MNPFLAALADNSGLDRGYVYRLNTEEYRAFPDPFPRGRYTLSEVETSIERYENPSGSGEKFRWDIHGRLLMPEHPRIAAAVVMIHGGAANEYEFLFTPDGPHEYVDLTRVPPEEARVGIAQHMASLGVPVLAVSLPGHYSRKPWPPILMRRPEFEIGQVPDDDELASRLAVYTFRMCVEALKALIAKALPGHPVFLWGHSTGGDFFHLMEQYGMTNRLVGGLGFGSGMPASMWKDIEIAASGQSQEQQARPFHRIRELTRRSPSVYAGNGSVGPNQPWGDAERWYALENDRRPQFKPPLQDIEHRGLDILLPEVRTASGLPDEELFITMRPDLDNLRGKKLLYFCGELDHGHWVQYASKGESCRREIYAIDRMLDYAEDARLVVIPGATHYGHIERWNERLASLMVAGLGAYFGLTIP